MHVFCQAKQKSQIKSQTERCKPHTKLGLAYSIIMPQHQKPHAGLPSEKNIAEEKTIFLSNLAKMYVLPNYSFT